MIVCAVLFGLNVLAIAFALIREYRTEDIRFSDVKLIYRS